MRGLMSLIGVILIIFGIVAFGYQGFTYAQREKVAQLGDIQITQEKEKVVYLSPTTGAIAFVAGIVLVVLGRRK